MWNTAGVTGAESSIGSAAARCGFAVDTTMVDISTPERVGCQEFWIGMLRILARRIPSRRAFLSDRHASLAAADTLVPVVTKSSWFVRPETNNRTGSFESRTAAATAPIVLAARGKTLAAFDGRCIL